MNKTIWKTLAIAVASAFALPVCAETITPPTIGDGGEDIALLGDMEVEKGTTGWEGHPNQRNLSIDGNALTMKGNTYTSGMGTHASSKVIVKLNGATRFVATVGIDAEVANDASFNANDSRWSNANYKVTVEGETGNTQVLAEGAVSFNDPVATVDVDCSGWKFLILESIAGDSNWGDHVDWGNAYFEYYARAATPPYVVTEDEKVGTSRLACATLVYSQPGVRFMHKLKPSSSLYTVTGVTGLPAGLTWNADRKLVEGIVENEGVYNYFVQVSDGASTLSEEVKLTVSANLEQPVPMMGWTSWNVYKAEFADAEVRATADGFIKNGLLAAGYEYVLIDDNWHAGSNYSGANHNGRAADGKPQYDTQKFPQGLKSITDYVHGKGLKIGIYSDAAERTCNSEFGSLGYEQIDADQYAEWEFDLLKYDYCHAPSDVETAKARYKAMGDALDKCGRNILFYICEWGIRDPWKWAAEVGGSTWRISYDSRNKWDFGAYDGSRCGVIQAVDIIKNLAAYAGPNRYNDADMMCVGLDPRDGGSPANEIANPGMTDTEQRSQFALWCMFASPLILSFDVTGDIPQTTLDIVTNEELIAVNQDRMGQQADLISSKNDIEIYCKDLENGDVAVAILNRGYNSKDVTLNLGDLPLEEGKSYRFRDLWAKEDVGEYAGSFTVNNVASHETKVYRITPSDAPVTTYSVTVNPTTNGSVRIANGSTVVEDLTAIAANSVLTILATGDEGYIVDEITVTGSTLNPADNTFRLVANTTVNVTFKEGTLPPVEYTIPSGEMHSNGETYVKKIYTEGAATNISKEYVSAPDNVYQLLDQTIVAQQGSTFNLHLDANSLGDESAYVVHQDLRYTQAYIYTDWAATAEFEELSVYGSNPPANNVAGNMEVMAINQSIVVPTVAPLGDTRIRVIYHNAWGKLNNGANSTNIADGMAYDIPVNVVAYVAVDETLAEAGVKIYATDGTIVIESEEQALASIYTANGALYRAPFNVMGRRIESVPAGLYIVKVDGVAKQVMVK